jgi:hypothetical protein
MFPDDVRSPEQKPQSSATLGQRLSYGFEVFEPDILTSDNESRPAVPVEGINLIAMLN